MVCRADIVCGRECMSNPRFISDTETRVSSCLVAIRKRLRNKTLPQHYFDLLNEIGFSWSLGKLIN